MGRPTCPSPGALLRVPNTTMFDYEWATLQHSLNCRTARRGARPRGDPGDERLARYGARPPRLVHYPGLKEDYVLHGFTPDAACSTASASPRDKLLCVVRTAPSYALYLAGAQRRAAAAPARAARRARRRRDAW